MRFDRPVGTLLLLWPTLAALWIASNGRPSLSLVVIFTLGTIVMRAAGCVINDYADRHLDAHVERTSQRPLAQKQIAEVDALVLFAILLATALVLVLFLNRQTQWLACAGAGIATLYPFTKRWTHLPQLVLGAAFSWGIIMAFAATGARLTDGAWLMFIASVFWIVAYDTIYAMVDRADDLRVGIKSTAILFGDADVAIVAALQAATVISLVLLGLPAPLRCCVFSGYHGRGRVVRASAAPDPRARTGALFRGLSQQRVGRLCAVCGYRHRAFLICRALVINRGDVMRRHLPFFHRSLATRGAWGHSGARFVTPT